MNLLVKTKRRCFASPEWYNRSMDTDGQSIVEDAVIIRKQESSGHCYMTDIGFDLFPVKRHLWEMRGRGSTHQYYNMKMCESGNKVCESFYSSAINKRVNDSITIKENLHSLASLHSSTFWYFSPFKGKILQSKFKHYNKKYI